jgi:hypothetical protein
VILLTATVAIAVDAKSAGDGVVTTIIEGSGAASIVGLLMSGLGLAPGWVAREFRFERYRDDVVLH